MTLTFRKNQPDFGTPFEPLLLIEHATQSPIEVNKISVEDNTEIAENIMFKDMSKVEQRLMSLPKLTPDKITLLQ